MKKYIKNYSSAFGYAIWVVVSFVAAQLIIGSVFFIGNDFFESGVISDTTINTIAAAATYALTLAIVVGVPRIGHHITKLTELGIENWPQWRDIWLAPLGAVVYVVLTAILASFAGNVEGFDPNQSQDIAFSNLGRSFEYLLAFITLVVMAPFAEEMIFRGYMFSKVRRRLGVIATVVLTSIVFAVLHLPGLSETGDFQWQWNAALDVFALALVLAMLREYTGGIWASVLLHMMKNGLAFYFLFINPDILRTIGG